MTRDFSHFPSHVNTHLRTLVCNILFSALKMLTGNSIKPDVCELGDNLKTFMCKVLIRLNYFGLKFYDEGPDGLKCGRQDIVSLRIRPKKKLKTKSIRMFRCPRLQYLSVDTQKVVVLPVVYYISNTHKAETACLYIQHGQEYPIFPLQIVSNVHEDRLLVSYIHNYWHSQEGNEESPSPNYVNLVTYFPAVRRQFLNFMELKNESKRE